MVCMSTGCVLILLSLVSLFFPPSVYQKNKKKEGIACFRGPHTDLTTPINDLSVEQFGTEFARVWSDIIMHHILA